ncbi:MAG: hypothetical protein N2513_10480, partial [Deltaproteobacteria bacterium]|nr:hypothetical protein [Deltaproteobacteria bacterium]
SKNQWLLKGLALFSWKVPERYDCKLPYLRLEIEGVKKVGTDSSIPKTSVSDDTQRVKELPDSGSEKSNSGNS